jgi:SAM-dependent methyltransferase
MESSYREQVLNYFKTKAHAYDEVESQVYWRLSDKLLWRLFNSLALERLSESFAFLDAGGGTGRWSEKVLSAYPDSIGHIRDISDDMLGQARRRAQCFESRLRVERGSIEDMAEVPDESFDVVFNFHNVIGFLADPALAIQEMVRVLRPGGYFVTVAPSKYHMTFFNLFLQNVGEAEEVQASSRGRFAKEMPAMNVFTSTELVGMYKDAALQDTRVFGFPKLVYPGFAETQLRGTSAHLGNLLEDEEAFERVLKLEEALLLDQVAVERGNNLFAIGRKNTR